MEQTSLFPASSIIFLVISACIGFNASSAINHSGVCGIMYVIDSIFRRSTIDIIFRILTAILESKRQLTSTVQREVQFRCGISSKVQQARLESVRCVSDRGPPIQ